jgi:5S rRNA maturation endonuclease (ribonuclease M5)
MVKFNPRLRQDIEKYLNYVIIVEGKKDVAALNHLGFKKVYAIHQTSLPLKERILQILNDINKKDKICILTDFDKKGKKLYLLLKSELQQLGARLDSSLRGILLKSRISHIEGLDKFIEKVERIK